MGRWVGGRFHGPLGATRAGRQGGGRSIAQQHHWGCITEEDQLQHGLATCLDTRAFKGARWQFLGMCLYSPWACTQWSRPGCLERRCLPALRVVGPATWVAVLAVVA